MARRQPKHSRTPAAVAPAVPVQPLAHDARTHAQALRTVLDSTPTDSRAPSIQAATGYRIETDKYTAQEKQAAEMAMDLAGQSRSALTFTENMGFPGFPTLSLLAQLSEYRNMASALAEDVIRKWGRVTSSGKSDDEKCQQLEAELLRMDVRAHVKTAVEHDQLFGGAHVYFKLRDDEDSRALPLVLRPFTVKEGSFEGLRVIEPYWVTPNFYNSIDPTAADFYKPSSWWLLGSLTHATRMQTLVSRPVPDMLKPAYSFRGVSMTQLAMPYVDNWLRTRQSVSDTVKQFSISGVLTDLQQSLLPGAATSLSNRAELINRFRDNRNILFLDKSTEEFFQVNTPLSGLDALQAQAQEQMSSVAQQPLVKLTGITPSGLNASSDGEIRVWYDRVGGYQNNVVGPLMLTTLRLAQLSLFGEIDEGIAWEWDPLHAMNELEQAEVAVKEAETDARYIETGVVSPEDVRSRLSRDPNSLYAGIADTDDLQAISDTDIEGITEHILQIGTDPVGAAPGGPTDTGLPEGAQAGVAQQEEATPGEGRPGAHASQLLPDPTPGQL